MSDKELLEHYQNFVKEGYFIPGPPRCEARLFNLGLGVCGESGEIADILKKMLGHKTSEDPKMIEHMYEEIGDVIWYLTQICNEFDFTLAGVMNYNMGKLIARYPEVHKKKESVDSE